MDIKAGRYEHYRGKKTWSVSHPGYGQCTVLAPDRDSAVVAAARVFGTQWTKTEFYTQCEVAKA